MLVPPSIHFTGNIRVAQSFKSLAIQFYSFIANQADIGGVNHVSRTLPLPNGSVIRVSSYRDGNYKLRTGNVVIVGSGVGFEERDEIQLIIKSPSGVFSAELNPAGVLELKPFTKDVGYSFSWTNYKDLACSVDVKDVIIQGKRYIDPFGSVGVIGAIALTSKKTGYIVNVNSGSQKLTIYNFSTSTTTLQLTSFLVIDSISVNAVNIISRKLNELILVIGKYPNILLEIPLPASSMVTTPITLPIITRVTSGTYVSTNVADLNTTYSTSSGYTISPFQITDTFYKQELPTRRDQNTSTLISFGEVTTIYEVGKFNYNSHITNLYTEATQIGTLKGALNAAVNTIKGYLSGSVNGNYNASRDIVRSPSPPYDLVSDEASQDGLTTTINNDVLFIDDQVEMVLNENIVEEIPLVTYSYPSGGGPVVDRRTTIRTLRIYVNDVLSYEKELQNSVLETSGGNAAIFSLSNPGIGTFTEPTQMDFGDFPPMGQFYAVTDKLYALITNELYDKSEILIFKVENLVVGGITTKVINPTIIHKIPIANYGDLKLALHLKSI
jgi:hypothetical protein